MLLIIFFTWGGASIFKLLWVSDASNSQLSPFSGGLTLADRSPLAQWCLVVYALHQAGGCPWPVTEHIRGIKAQPSPQAQQPECCNAPSTALHGIRWRLNFSWVIFAKLLLLSHLASLGPLEIFFLRAFPQRSFTQESLPQALLH